VHAGYIASAMASGGRVAPVPLAALALLLQQLALFLQAPTALAAPSDALGAWDAGLQGAGWQRQQRAELLQSAAQRRSELSVRSHAGPLLPCPVPPETPPLPDGPLPAELDALMKDVEQELETMFTSSAATGGSATIVYGDRVLLSYGFGTTTAGGTTKCNGETVFRVGSISKVFTDLLLYRFAEEGSVSISTSVTELAPNYSPTWPQGKTATPQGTTLRDLGSHMAGLPRYSPCIFGACNITTAEAIERMNNWTLLFEPGSRLAYSNTGFALLGRLLEAVDSPSSPKGEAYEVAVAKLATVLAMSTTGAEPPHDLSRLARGYEQGQLIPVQNLGFANPCGGVFSSANDMAKLLSFLLRDNAPRDDANGSGQPMDSATVRRWLTERAYVNPSDLNCPHCAYYTEWGIPWQNLRVNNELMGNFSRFYLLSKDGSVPGYNSQMVLQPDMKLGIFTTMSTGGAREGPFFSDTLTAFAFGLLPRFYDYLVAQPQLSRLPPSPGDFVGVYGALIGGGSVAVQIGRNSSGVFGDTILYALGNENLGWAPMQPLAWAGGDVLEMIPFPQDQCFSIEGGNNWNGAYNLCADESHPRHKNDCHHSTSTAIACSPVADPHPIRGRPLFWHCSQVWTRQRHQSSDERDGRRHRL
jgi:CubicO group peptidase (beta-lactamase class C family)